MRSVSWGSVLSLTNDCLTERTQAAITQPEVVKGFLCPVSSHLHETIKTQRSSVSSCLSRRDKLIIVTGPRYLSDPIQSKACAQWINRHNQQLSRVQLMMNVDYASERAISYNGKSFVEPYYLTGGLVNTRSQLLEASALAPLCAILVDPISQVYFNDLFTIGIVPNGGRAFVDLASGFKFPVGFGCDASGLKDLPRALDGTKCCRSQLTLLDRGQVGVLSSNGNEDVFVVLRFGDFRTDAFISTAQELQEGVKIMVDMKIELNYKRYIETIRDLQRSEIGDRIIGYRISSGDKYPYEKFPFLEEGETEASLVKPLISKLSKFSKFVKREPLDPWVHVEKLITEIDRAI